jgi:putative membrane protein
MNEDLIYAAFQSPSIYVWTTRIAVTTIAVLVLARLLSGVEVRDIKNALIVAALISIVNPLTGKMIDYLTLPPTLVALGGVTFVVDTALIMLADFVLSGFKVQNIQWAFGMAVILAVVNYMIFNVL